MPTRQDTHSAQILWLCFGGVATEQLLETTGGQSHRIGPVTIHPAQFGHWEQRGWVERDRGNAHTSDNGRGKVKVRLTAEGRRIADDWGRSV